MKKNRDFNEKLASLIRTIRLVSNFTQSYVAAKMRISNTAYHDLETGKTLLTPKRIEQVAEVFEIPFEALIRFNTTFIINSILQRQGIGDKNDYETRIARLEERNQELVSILKIAVQSGPLNE
ncbi:helix-turn-helix transcriptional regulator [Chitinophaga niabensis]|uniref:helix-turn-helix domain-containing protein n=1 Tax=Chitinophaga niabensis TaxID=536979 RepID=UPI0031BAD786